MKKLRIFYLLSKDDIGGAERYVRDLSENLNPQKYETVILRGGRDIRWLSNRYLPYFLFINDWFALFELTRIFKKRKPDIVHLNNSKAGVIGALAAKRADKNIRVVFTAHGWVFQKGSPVSLLRRWFYTVLHQYAARFQDAIITVSDFDRNLALEKKITTTEKITTIHNGIDSETLTFLPRDEAREKLDPDQEVPRSDTLWIGSIGRLVKEKDYPTLVRAATRTRENIHFFIIGEGPEKKSLHALIEQHGLQERFHLLGRHERAHTYLKAFDVFLLSSVKEGLPYTLLEAMSAGIPVVASRVGGIPELIPQNNLLIAPKSPEDFSRAIKDLLDDSERRKKIAHENGRHIQDNFSLSDMVSKTEAIYRMLKR